MSPPEQANILVAKADEDIHVLEALCDDASTSDSIWGFHCQQAVEKLLKAMLTRREIVFPFTHRLFDLADRLEDAGIAIAPEAESLLDFTPYAVEFRYSQLSESDESPVNRKSILDQIR